MYYCYYCCSICLCIRWRWFLVMLTACAASPQAHVRLTTSRQVLSAVTPFLFDFIGHDYKVNTWQSICSTWDSVSGLGQLWLDGKPSSRKFISSGSNISGPIIIVLGQEQDTHGGGFDIKQSFVGMMSDVHLWDHILSPCEIQNYMHHLNFAPGNVLNWRALEFQTTGRVLIEDKQEIKTCY
uniref:Pentraxin family member n=1 Tax=Sander lucioperca TaxID=283035 RepID=A0A8C9XYF3_SANLU